MLKLRPESVVSRQAELIPAGEIAAIENPSLSLMILRCSSIEHKHDIVRAE